MSITVENEPIIIDDDDDDYDFERKSSKEQPAEEARNPDLHCVLCLRQHNSNSKFYEYQNADCAAFCEYVKDVLGFKLNQERLFICMPCCKMVEMVDGFRQSCLKANQVGVGLKCEDHWFSEETYKAIERIDETIRSHSEQMEPAVNGIPSEVHFDGVKDADDVVSIKSDQENETNMTMSKDESEASFFPYGIELEMEDPEEYIYMNSPDQTGMDSSNLLEPMANSSGTNKKQATAKTNYDSRYKCMICGAVLSNKTNLNEHLFVHGEATQQCKFCHKKFKQRTNLLRHHRTKHGDIPVRKLYPPLEFKFQE